MENEIIISVSSYIIRFCLANKEISFIIYYAIAKFHSSIDNWIQRWKSVNNARNFTYNFCLKHSISQQIKI